MCVFCDETHYAQCIYITRSIMVTGWAPLWSNWAADSESLGATKTAFFWLWWDLSCKQLTTTQPLSLRTRKQWPPLCLSSVGFTQPLVGVYLQVIVWTCLCTMLYIHRGQPSRIVECEYTIVFWSGLALKLCEGANGSHDSLLDLSLCSTKLRHWGISE